MSTAVGFLEWFRGRKNEVEGGGPVSNQKVNELLETKASFSVQVIRGPNITAKYDLWPLRSYLTNELELCRATALVISIDIRYRMVTSDVRLDFVVPHNLGMSCKRENLSAIVTETQQIVNY